MSTIRVQALPKFPASVEAGDGILVERSGGVFSFSVDPEFLPSFSSGTPYTIGDLLIADGANSIDALADVATGSVLLSGGVGAAPVYGKAGLSTHVSGILPAANGGFGISVAAATGIPVFASGTPSFLSQLVFTPENYGAAGNAISVTSNVTISSGSPNLLVAGASFTAADVGKSIIVKGAGAAGIPLSSTILTFTDATHVVLAHNAATTLTASSKQVVYGRDDTAEYMTGLAALAAGTIKNFAHSPTAAGYLVLPTDASRAAHTTLGSISARNGIRFDGQGVPVYVGYPTLAQGYFLVVTNCIDVEVLGLKGQSLSGKSPDGTTAAFDWLSFVDTCHNARVISFDLTGGNRGIDIARSFGTTAYGEGFTLIGRTTDIFYPLANRANGKGTRAFIESDNPGRPWSVYNVHDCHCDQTVKDPTSSAIISCSGHSTDISGNATTGIRYRVTEKASTTSFITVTIGHDQGDASVSDIATTIQAHIEFDVDLPSAGTNAQVFTTTAFKGNNATRNPGDVTGDKQFITITGQINGRALSNPIIALCPATQGFTGLCDAHYVFDNLKIPNQTNNPILVGKNVKTRWINIDSPNLSQPTYETPVAADHVWTDVFFTALGSFTTRRFRTPTRIFDPTASGTPEIYDGVPQYITDGTALRGVINAQSTGLVLAAQSTSSLRLQADGGSTGWDVITGGHLRPVTDNIFTFGDATHRAASMHHLLGKIYGSSSGVITTQAQAAAGTFNWNWPTSAGTAGQALLSGGGGSSPMTWGAAPVVVAKHQKFTASGTYTPSAGMLHCIIECVGAGGGGGGGAGGVNQIFNGAGGGAGSYARKYATAATIGASQTVTIGAAGTGATAGANAGGAGGDTSVGSLCIGKGGAGGGFSSGGAYPSSGAGGVAGTGDVTSAGAPGGPGFHNSGNATALLPSGNGGSSIFGGGALGTNAAGGATAAGVAGSNYGSGGSGGSTNNIAGNAAGGAGSAGFVVITEFCSQ